jgi:YYY domain-containing protein
MRDLLAWALATELVGLAVLPLLRVFFGNRRDAALLCRPLGLAIVAWGGWVVGLAAAPIGFSRPALLFILLVVGLGSWVVLPRLSATPAREPAWGDPERLGAALFWIPAAVLFLIRAAGPAIDGQEKFMDLAFLNSLSRFSGMPPADPWMSGRTINYYYWGYLLAAVQTKLSNVAPMVAYNLAIGSFAGFSFGAAACLGLRLSRGDLRAGLAAGAGTVFAGNLTGAFDAWNAPFARDFDYFHASRVIAAGNTINEFPFFTFFHADLHPHLLAFPYFVAAFAVAHRWMERGPGGRAWTRGAWILLVALVCGTARAASLWNMPAIAILLVFCGAMRPARGERVPGFWQAFGGVFLGLLVLLLSMVLFYSYTSSFQLENRGLGKATMFSGLIEFLGVWGLIFAAAAAALWPTPAGATEAARQRRDAFAAGAAAAALAAGLASSRPAAAVLLFLIALAAAAGWRSLRAAEPDPGGVFAAFLVLLGLAMVLGCELVYLKDTYAPELQRMNTIFKFYHQAWPLLVIGVAVFAVRAWDRAGAVRWLSPARAVLAAAGLLTLLWPVNAAVSRLRQREGPFSLDARGPLRARDAGDAAAIEWLIANAPVGSVVLEASGDPYSEYARIASHTGIPTVLGWANHEGLWRSNDAELQERLAQIKIFYTTRDARLAYEVLRRYGVTHVAIGNLERRTYPNADAVARFPFLRPVVEGDTEILAVARPVQPEGRASQPTPR